MDSLYLTWQFKTSQISDKGKCIHFIVWQLLKMHSMGLNKNHFCLTSVYHHLTVRIRCGERSFPKGHICAFFFFFSNQLVKSNNTKVISETKGGHTGHISSAGYKSFGLK